MGTNTQKNHKCQFGNVGVPGPELDDQFQDWNGAEMGSNIYTDEHKNIKGYKM